MPSARAHVHAVAQRRFAPSPLVHSCRLTRYVLGTGHARKLADKFGSFQIENEISVTNCNLHSSPLRCSQSPPVVTLWLPVARQRLGQHFLGNNGWRKRILDNLRLAPNETWIEIGPGHGELTKLLAGDGRKVVAIEADAALAEGLRANIDSFPDEWAGVSVVTSDVLQADIGKLIEGPFRVYGSLPYYITSPILQHLFQWAERIASIHIVIQLEVAERIAAEPGRRDYGYLSTLCQFYTRPKIAFHIPPGAFRPPPKVQSALVEMKLPGEGATLPISSAPEFFDFLQACFAQKRKTLRNNLLGRWSDAEIHEALGEAGLRADARAEQLTLRQFGEIFRGISVR